MPSRLSLLILLLALLLAPAQAFASPPDPRHPPRFGVYVRDHVHLTGSEQARAAGARWIHLLLLWNQIEKRPGEYDWSASDAYLSEAAEQGYTIILTIQSNPDWAAATTCGPIDPDHLDEFAAFLSAAVRRYSAAPYRVRFWALYNEPDNADAREHAWLGGCWGKGLPTSAANAGGAAYAHMLDIAYHAIKSANPRAIVLIGGLAYDNFISWGGIFDPTFLDDFLAAGGGGFMDMVNFHYFTPWAWAWNTGNPYESDLIGKANWIRGEFQRLTGRTYPMLTTELGSPSSGPESGVPLSEELSARDVIKLFARGMAVNLHTMVWFETVDAANDPYKYGLLRQDLSPKPAYAAYRTAAKELSAARYLFNLGDITTPSEGLTPNDQVEGYVFDDLGHRKYAFWSRTEATVDYTFLFDASDPLLRVVDKAGQVTMVRDGGPGDGDGEVNGAIVLAIPPSPLIIEDLTFDLRLFAPAFLMQ